MTFRDEWSKRTEEVQEILYRYLPEETGYQKTLLQAMNYSMQAGGKRLRPLLMQETYRLFGGTGMDCGAIYGGDGDDSYPFPDSR